MRKLLYLLCGLLWISNLLYSQAPQAFNYQAVVRNRTGEVLKAQPLDIQITILSDHAQGPTVYEETHATTTSDAGTISLQIGKGTPLQGKFEEIDWASGKEYFLNTTFTLNNETITLGAVQILSVPYALYAQRSGEKHNLILKDGMLSIEGGGEGIKLPTGGGSGQCLWDQGLGEIYHKGAISLKQNNISYLQANADTDGVGHLRLNYKGDKSITFDQGEIVTYNTGEQPKVKIVNTGNTENGGIGIWGGGVERLSLLAPQIEGGTGSSIYMKGKDATKKLVSLVADDYDGSLSLLSAGSKSKSNTYLSGNGSIGLYGDNGKPNIILSSADEKNNSGAIGTFDADGNFLIKISSATSSNGKDAGIYICYKGKERGAFQITNGKSSLITDEIYLDGKLLNPAPTYYAAELKSTDSYAPCFVSESIDKQITFRGTASLNNGQFKIILPPEETEKIDESSITIQVTPLSSASKGLAVIHKNNRSFTVTELMSGTGSYDFDWTLTAMIKETPQMRSDNDYKGSGPKEFKY